MVDGLLYVISHDKKNHLFEKILVRLLPSKKMPGKIVVQQVCVSQNLKAKINTYSAD